MKLGETILKYRTGLGLSQEKLAEAVGVSRQAVSKWEVGDAIPDTDKLIPLARTLGITVDELLGNIPEEEEAAEPNLSGSYDAVWEVPSDVRPAEKPPGWFAAHWYWLGLIPVIWGGWRLLQILLFLVLALLNFAGSGTMLGAGAVEIITDAEVSLLG